MDVLATVFACFPHLYGRIANIIVELSTDNSGLASILGYGRHKSKM